MNVIKGTITKQINRSVNHVFKIVLNVIMIMNVRHVEIKNIFLTKKNVFYATKKLQDVKSVQLGFKKSMESFV